MKAKIYAFTSALFGFHGNWGVAGEIGESQIGAILDGSIFVLVLVKAVIVVYFNTNLFGIGLF